MFLGGIYTGNAKASLQGPAAVAILFTPHLWAAFLPTQDSEAIPERGIGTRGGSQVPEASKCLF